MKIRAIEAIPFRLPLREPVKFAVGQLNHLDHVLVRVHTDEGITGVAEAPARHMIYGETTKSIVSAITEFFAPTLLGMDAYRLEEIWTRMDALPWNHCAKASIDTALHDILCQVYNVPLFKFLGGHRDEVEVCHILGVGPPQVVAKKASELRSLYGFRWFKLKGGLDPKNDTETIAAVRQELGADVQLTVDCNQGYTADVAERTLPTWDQFNLTWIEEPCPSNDPVGRQRVARACRTPFMLDESAFLPPDIIREAALGSCRIVALKLARTGISKSKKILNISEAHGLQVIVGSQADSEPGTLASAHFAAAHAITSRTAAELSFFLDASDRITRESLDITNGMMSLPHTPGIGFSIDERRLRRLRMD